VKKKHFIFIIQNNNKNRKHIEIQNKKDKSFNKKLKHEPGLKKLGDFTVFEGHGYPLVINNKNSSNFFLNEKYTYNSKKTKI
jgi:hypothetical protein